MRPIARRAAAMSATVALTLGLGVGSAQAATTELSGTVNCSGTQTVYSTVRLMQQPSRTDLYLSRAVGRTSSGYAMRIGTLIVANGRYHYGYFPGADRFETLQQNNNYVENTRFRITAMMAQPSRGTCSNSWAGKLTF